MNKEALQSVIAALREGRTPSLSVEDFPCFSQRPLPFSLLFPYV